jgi:hypothetical protein
MGSLLKKIKTAFIGAAKNPHDRTVFHRMSLIAFFAWVGLGADGLSSSCYGPEEAFLALGGHPYLGSAEKRFFTGHPTGRSFSGGPESVTRPNQTIRAAATFRFLASRPNLTHISLPSM